MSLKLFVDDNRPFPQGFQCVRTYEDAISYLRLFPPFDFISLDYDLGDGHTGLDILRWLHEHDKAPQRLNIHSDHPEGAPAMASYAREHLPTTRITLNTL